jgi:hypothetical protein
LRVDIPVLFDKPRFNPLVEQQFGRRTDRVPSGIPQFSPRFGFNWDVRADRSAQQRGGLGVFVGRPAYVWIGNAYQNTGLGLVQLTCQNSAGVVRAPRFSEATVRNPPTSCADGTTAATSGDVNLLSDRLRFPQVLRGSLAYDHRLMWDWVASLEAMYSRTLNSFFYVNRALVGPQGTDRNGRTVYGTMATTGISSPALVSNRRNVIDVGNESRDHAYSLTTSLQRHFANTFEFNASYTYAQARDVQSLTSSVAASNWRFGRALSGDHASLALGRSRFELPHRLVFSGTYSYSTLTDLSLVYVGQSGSNFDYVYGGSGGRGDLNADGAQGNDLVYVPTSASDPNEILFSGVSTEAGADNSAAAQAQRVTRQQQQFDQFIESTDCLRRARGRMLTRNSCRTPWTNTLNVSVRQSVGVMHGQSLSLQLDVFNFLNLVNRNWGQQALLPGGQAPLPLLTHVGQTAGTLSGPGAKSQGIFTFDPAAVKFDRQNAASNYQLQLSARISF